MTKRSFKSVFSDPQNIIALGVTLISACALIVSIFQTRIMVEQRKLMHEQAKASVWPRLSIEINKSHKIEDNRVLRFAILISNDGVGPAIVSGAKVYFKDEPVTYWGALFQEFALPDSVHFYVNTANINHTIIKIGDTVKALDLSNNLPLAQAFYDNVQDIRIEIVYESIYGDKWMVTRQGADNQTKALPREFKLVEEGQFLN